MPPANDTNALKITKTQRDELADELLEGARWFKTRKMSDLYGDEIRWMHSAAGAIRFARAVEERVQSGKA